MIHNESGTIHIAGAGPAGLTAAIILARANRNVIVHEAQSEVGYRFQRDLQGLENWTHQMDVLDELRSLGITTNFAARPSYRGEVFDAWERRYEITSSEPLFYLVERGPGKFSLDTALLRQAHDLGVEFRFSDRLRKLTGPAVLATGPKAADAIAVGYHFDTGMPEGFWVICDDRIAPQGYAYLLVMNGRGTVKTCMFADFKRERTYVQRTVEAFQRLANLEMTNPRLHGGVGNFFLPPSAMTGTRLMVGEHAGFQDALWGFGMRWAIRSGVLAARSLIEGADFDGLCRRELSPWVRTSFTNRLLYRLLGNRGYRWILKRYKAVDARKFLGRQYHPSRLRLLIAPFAMSWFGSRRRDLGCHEDDCECVWCRCGGEHKTVKNTES